LFVAQQSLDYAILLLRRGQADDRQRALAIIDAVFATQHHAPDGDRGRFPMLLPETWRDLNATLFLAPSLAELYTRWLPALPAPLADRVRAGVLEAREAIERRWADEVFDLHRDFTAYSNIFVLYIQALLLFGHCLGCERLLRDGDAQWQRWFHHVSTYGIDEFCSPTYNEVDYEGLLGILSAATSPRMRTEVTLVLDYLSALQHAVSHPLLRMGVVGTSRDYRLFAQPGGGAFRFLDDAGNADYHPPRAVLDEFRQRQYPYRAAGRASLVPFRFQSWQLQHAAMGSMTGGHYFPQQIHLMAAVGTSPQDRACAFFQADPWNPLNGYVCQQDGRALCLFTRTATSYHLIQRRERVTSLPAPDTLPPCLGLTEGWTIDRCEPGTLVATAGGYALHVRAFALDDNRMRPVTFTPDTVRIGYQQSVAGWRVEEDVRWCACLVELVPDTMTPAAAVLQGHIDQQSVRLTESGGLALHLARKPSGELVELYAQDWRTLPLIDAPAYHCAAGDLSAAACDTP
jgi:hypothetical protein